MLAANSFYLRITADQGLNVSVRLEPYRFNYFEAFRGSNESDTLSLISW